MGRAVRFSLILVMAVGMLLGMYAWADTANEKAERPYLCVKGILFDSDVPLALVNQDVLGVGETVAGAKIIEISSSSVKFEYEGEIFNQQVGECKQTASSFYEKVVPEKVSEVFGQQQPTKDLYSAVRRNIPNAALDEETKEKLGHLAAIAMSFILFIVLAFVAAYIFSAFALQLIAKKTDTENGWLAWIPIANCYLMCRIAGKPGWWLLLLLVPLINLIIFFVISIGIVLLSERTSWILWMCSW